MSNGDLQHSRYVHGQGFVWRRVRHTYQQHFTRIENSLQLRATIRAGAHSDLGGYPLYLVCEDGGCLCFKCAEKEYRMLAHGWRNDDKQWKVIGCAVNYEDGDLYCGHCNERIAPAYGDD